MSRNIVICCDGTANEFAEDRTNVVKLYYTLEHDSERQVTFYHPGLGTMEPSGALTPLARQVTKGLGMALGYGLSSDIRDAYVFLMENLRSDDKIFLFGFSRGAYTARAVCSLLHMYGLIFPGNAPLVSYATRMMMAIEKARLLDEKKQKATNEEKKAVQRYFDLAKDFGSAMSRCECKPHFVGVWDTVSSVGWKDTPLKLPFIADNPDIQIGRHAIAIDERRAFFRTNRWIPSSKAEEHGPKNVQQVWFPGVHCDVGGGYAEAESGLSKLALQWMLAEAKSAGLLVNREREHEVLGLSPGSRYAKANADAFMHESLKGAWKLAEWVRKPHYDYTTGKTEMRRNHGQRRTIPPDSLIHESVFLREGGKYAQTIGLPKNYVRVSTQEAPKQEMPSETPPPPTL
jgi:uncharacterized protein (DUF2235 family)